MKSNENVFYLRSKDNYSAVLVVDSGIYTLKNGSTVSANVSTHFKVADRYEKDERGWN